jgi:two-component system response regulator DevR
MIRIGLLDDHEIVRRGVRELLNAQSDFTVVVEAGSFQEALGTFDVASIDVAVLDVRLPDGNGVELCRLLLEQKHDLACLMLTSFADDEALDAALLAGARGYVLKEIKGVELVNAIRGVAAGELLISSDVVAHVRQRLRRRADELQRVENLSAQQYRILELLSEGLTNREIAQQMFLAEKTVKNYVSTLLAKLGFQRRTEAALFAQNHLTMSDESSAHDRPQERT